MNPTSHSQPRAAGEAAHTLQSCNLVGMRADRSSSRRNPGMESPFFADIVTDTDLLAHVRGESYTEAEARRAFIVRACNSHAALVEALELANAIIGDLTGEKTRLNRAGRLNAVQSAPAVLRQARAALQSAKEGGAK